MLKEMNMPINMAMAMVMVMVMATATAMAMATGMGMVLHTLPIILMIKKVKKLYLKKLKIYLGVENT